MGHNDPTKAQAPNGAQQQGNRGKLNVILHGLFTLFEDGEIIARLPNMGSEHIYKAGTWLAETALDEHADLRLKGVNKGAEKFSPEMNVILDGVRLCDCGCEDQTVFATLRFPYPTERIRSLRPLTIPKGALGGVDAKKVDGLSTLHPLLSATVQVLTYDFQSDAELRLGDHHWEPVLQHNPDGTNYVNLHIFSEPELSPTEEHVRHAFQSTTSMFAGLDLTLQNPAKPDFTNGTVGDIPGVHLLELEDLIHRRRRLDILGRAIRESRDVNSVWDEPEPFYGGDLSTCYGFLIGRPHNPLM